MRRSDEPRGELEDRSYGAWVFIAGFVVHVALKLPHMITGLRSRSMRAELRTPLAQTRPEPPDTYGLVATDPAPATMSRRGALALVGGGGVLVAVLSVGQVIGGAARGAALLLPRGRSYGDGPNDFQVNRTAVAAGITPAATGAGWASDSGDAAGHAATHRDPADRLRRGVGDDPDVGGRAVGRPRRRRRGAGTRVRDGGVP